MFFTVECSQNIPYTDFSHKQFPTKKGDIALVPKDLPDLLYAFQQQMDELFEKLFPLEKKGNYGEREYSPLIDCFETGEYYIVEIELPGFSRENLNLSIFHNLLIIDGLKQEEGKNTKVNYICLEREFGRFSRTIEIPLMVDFCGAKARYEKGILSVSFRKISETGAIMKDIRIE